MRKILLAIILFGCQFTIFCQSFSDDFENYNAGDMLAATSSDWATWTSANGGLDDVAVSVANAHSGTNSIYFASTATGGGPSDIILPFPGVLNVGQFNLEMWFYVNADQGAYFNLQGGANPGATWAADAFFLPGGIAQFNSGGTLLLAASYPENAWFKFRMENNLSTNTWEVFIDDVSQGTYSNGSTQIASMDIYPLSGNQFYVDDVSYEFTGYTLPVLNGAVTSINQMSGLLAGQSVNPQVVVRNLGTTTITSFTLEISYNGTIYNQNISGVTIPSLGFYTVNFTESYSIVAGLNQAVATISLVNGSFVDDESIDDTKSLNVNPIVPAPGKKVIAEEATGTWCPWCVRGTVFMERLSTTYGNLYIGIAVHNGDPMVVAPYDAAIGTLIGGYPSGVVDRGPEYDPSQFEIPFLERIQIAPKAFITNGATWDATTRTLQVSATTTFQETVSGNYKIAVVLTEDDVTGTGSQWNQANAYAGGSNGNMGGYETLPNPVPASQMSYDHVARAISPSFAGLPNAYTGMMNLGNASTHNFTFTLPTTWEEDLMHIVAMVIAPDGTIDNAFSASLNAAIENGFVSGTNVVGMTSLSSVEEELTIYPNPTNNQCNINMHLINGTKLSVEIYSLDGKKLVSKDYGTLSGDFILPINMSEWANGMYHARIIRDGVAIARTIIKE